MITDRSVGCSTARTTAVRHPPDGARSVTLVPLLEPRVAEVVVAVALPEPLLVVLHERQPGDPLRALPEVEPRDEQPHRAAVFARERTSFVRPHDPRLPVPDLLQRQVRRVTRGRGGK